MNRRALAGLVAVAAFGVGAAPARASIPEMRFWVEYAGTGSVAFACHNVAVYQSGTWVDHGFATSVSCSLNGYQSAPVVSGDEHATSAGVASANVGSTVQVCLHAYTRYLYPHITFHSFDACTTVTLGPAGTLYLPYVG